MPQNPTDFAAFVTWGFYGLAAVAGGLLLRFLPRIAKSIEELNINVAVLLSQFRSLEGTVTKHDEKFAKGDERFAFVERELAELRGYSKKERHRGGGG